MKICKFLILIQRIYLTSNLDSKLISENLLGILYNLKSRNSIIQALMQTEILVSKFNLKYLENVFQNRSQDAFGKDIMDEKHKNQMEKQFEDNFNPQQNIYLQKNSVIFIKINKFRIYKRKKKNIGYNFTIYLLNFQRKHKLKIGFNFNIIERFNRLTTLSIVNWR